MKFPMGHNDILRCEVVPLQVRQVCKQEWCGEIGQMCQDPQTSPSTAWLAAAG